MANSSVDGSAGPGEAEYRGRNLRGVSFRGKNLDGADFGEADLRGADFTGANLRGADLTGARLGLRLHTGLVILLLTAAVAVAAAATSAIIAGEFRDRVQSPEWEVLASGAWSAALALVFLALLYFRGPRAALIVFPIMMVTSLIIGFIVKSAFADYDASFAVMTVAIMLLLVLVVLVGILVRVLTTTFGLVFLVALTLAAGVASGTFHGGIVVIFLSIFMTAVARRAAGRSERDRPIERLAYRILTMRGTRFTGADLTGANFTGTQVIHIETSGALVDGVVWEKSKGPSPLVLDTRRSQEPPASFE